MNKILRKENLRPLIVLVAICVVIAALVAAVNLIANPIIKAREEEKVSGALLVVLPGGKDFEKLKLNENYPAGVNSAYKADIGFVFEVKTQGKEAMTVMCGVDNEGRLVKLDVISESETPGYKELVFPYVTGDEGVYNGVSYDKLELELFTGATFTSNGVYNAVKAALDAYVVATGAEVEPEPEPNLAKDESEVLRLAADLVENSNGFTRVELNGEYESLVSLYRENGGKGYVAYVLVPSSTYKGTVESEALIYIGNDAKIKALNKLTWKTSDAIYGYDPPTPEEVDAFYNRFPDNDNLSVDGVELVTNATNTSTRVVESFEEALDAVANINKTPRTIGIVITVALVLVAICAIICLKKRRGEKQ